MLPGNHQQMHGAGVLQNLPIRGGQTGAIPQHQGGQARLAALGIHGQQPLTQAIAPRIARWDQALTVLYRAGCTDALGQQPGFAVKAVKIQ